MPGYEGVTQRLPKVCSRCGGEMRNGIAAGVAPRYHAVQTWPVAWIEGSPPLSTLFGIDASQSDIFRIAA